MSFTNKPLLADVILMTDGTTLKNKWFIIADGFVIVSDSSEDTRPNIYNANEICSLEGVHIDSQCKSQRVRM